MPSPFASEEMFDIVVKYSEVTLKSGLKSLAVIKTEEMEQRLKDKLQEIHTQWVVPNWKQSNEVLRQCMKWEPELGQRALDWALYRTLMMESFMRTWDIKNDSGESVACTKKYMDMLDPNIAAALCDAFLKKTTVTEEDLGN